MSFWKVGNVVKHYECLKWIVYLVAVPKDAIVEGKKWINLFIAEKNVNWDWKRDYFKVK